MQGPVFISYSSKDAVLANKIVAFLESQGYPCWIAPRDIASGRDYTDMINDAILNCRAVVLIVSGRSLQSQWVKKELSTAVSYNKLIIPYRISNVEITGGLQFLLNNVQWIEAVANPTGHFQDLVDGLEQRLATVAAPAKKQVKVIPLAIGLVVLVAVGFVLLKGTGKKPVEASLVEETPAVVEQPAAEPIEQQPVAAPAVSERKPAADKKEIKKEKKEASKEVAKEVAKEVTKEESKAVEKTVQETPVETAPDTAGQAQAQKAAAKERDFQRRLRMAKNLYIDHSYREALSLFEELHREKPQDKEVNAYLKDCRKLASGQ